MCIDFGTAKLSILRAVDKHEPSLTHSQTRKAERRSGHLWSGILSDISCHMGQGLCMMYFTPGTQIFGWSRLTVPKHGFTQAQSDCNVC